MKDLLFSDFQETVADSLIRHKSVLDGITKLQESISRVNRAIAKSVTSCGCVTIQAEKHAVPEGLSLTQLRDLLDSDIRGQLCDQCRETLETEMGTSLFYITAVMNAMGLSLYDTLLKEHQRVKALGVFHVS